ncbi:MAG: hypothetical protein AB1918_13470, partial [Pseudomonadota bacterium]
MERAGARRPHSLRARVHALYHGHSLAARRFGYARIGFDVALIAFFVVLSFVEAGRWLVPVDLALAVALSVDLGLR